MSTMFDKSREDRQIQKEAMAEIGRRLYVAGHLVGHDGNLSSRASDGTIWITASGVSKGFLSPDQMVRLNLQGKQLEGEGRASSEYQMHLAVYRELPRVRAVIHAHPPYATVFACAGKTLDSHSLMEAAMQLGPVPCTGFAMPGTREVADAILPYLHNSSALLLGNHGALTWGDSLEEAWMRMEVLEYSARIEYLSQGLGELRPIPEEALKYLKSLPKKVKQ